tara:strand:+ start:711 stop:1067 length:357 start_codon:yes stop_codon:yes gene_type:complete
MKTFPNTTDVVQDDVLVRDIRKKSETNATIALGNALMKGHTTKVGNHSLQSRSLSSKPSTLRGFLWISDFNYDIIEQYRKDYPIGTNLKDKCFYVISEDDEGEEQITVQFYSEYLPLI